LLDPFGQTDIAERLTFVNGSLNQVVPFPLPVELQQPEDPITFRASRLTEFEGDGATHKASLDNRVHKWPPNKPFARNFWTKPQRRFYQRIMSGVESAIARGETLRFMTLTSSPNSPTDFHRSFRKLVKRCRRAFKKFEYTRVREYTISGLIHAHLIYRGTFIPQAWLSKVWNELHKAPIVYIRKVDYTGHSLGAYLVKYLTKTSERYSWSWGWVYAGFVKDWKQMLRTYPFEEAIERWKIHLHWHDKPVIPNHVQTSFERD